MASCIIINWNLWKMLKKKKEPEYLIFVSIHLNLITILIHINIDDICYK